MYLRVLTPLCRVERVRETCRIQSNQIFDVPKSLVHWGSIGKMDSNSRHTHVQQIHPNSLFPASVRALSLLSPNKCVKVYTCRVYWDRKRGSVPVMGIACCLGVVVWKKVVPRPYCSLPYQFLSLPSTQPIHFPREKCIMSRRENKRNRRSLNPDQYQWAYKRNLPLQLIPNHTPHIQM